jgi:hypothetical protein
LSSSTSSLSLCTSRSINRPNRSATTSTTVTVAAAIASEIDPVASPTPASSVVRIGR